MVKSFHSKNDVSSSGYEDNGSDTDEHPKQHSNQAKNISEIISANTKYKRLQKQNKTIETQVGSDDEVFLLRVPKLINPTDLINSKFSTCKKSKVKTTSETYHMKPLHDVAEHKLFINSVFLKKINPVSILQLEKYVENTSKDDDITEESKHIPLPKDLTARHPIFGSRYEAKIQLQEEIQQKLQQALQRFEKTKKLPKQKKKVEDQDEFDDKSLLISQMLEEKLKSKKLKKTENTLKIDSSQTCDAIGLDIVEQKKKSKKQKNQVMIENNIEVQDIKNEIIIHNDHLLELDESKKTHKDKGVGIHSTKETKRKKKHKHSTTLEIEDTDGFTRMLDDQEHFPLDCSMNEDEKNFTPRIKVELLSDVDLNESSFQKKNKRKNKSEEIGNSSCIKQEFEENSAYTQSFPEKKRKKKKDNFSVEIKKEMESESEYPEPSFIGKKNKKRRRDSDITFVTPETIKQEFDDSFMPPTKKRKPSILSSTVIKEASPEFKPDVSAIVMDERTAKKKNKRKSTDNQCNMIQDLLSNVRNSLENVKVKSPKKKLS